ncbi:F-box domain-containing protein [Favolaschia claudopus]|uniref:F-box domain-containing protein n=1 Tax=Favolaschia claudopus TaxID=2862362 RepID=A0AAW0DSI1_9AGAR
MCRAMPATLYGNFDYSSAEGRQKSRELLKLFLQRSYPVNVLVSLRLLSAANAAVLPTHWLPEIVAQLDRLQSLSVVFSIKQDDLSSEFASLRDAAAPNLVHLEIANIDETLYGPWIERPRSDLEVFSGGAPKLSSVRMCGFFPSPPPPWKTSLTRLQIAMGGQPLRVQKDVRYLSILTQSPWLTHLLLDLACIHSVPTNHQIHIPLLEFLTLHINEDGQYESYLKDALDSFDCPALTELVFVGSHGDQVFSLLKMPHLPRASFPTLHSLSFIYTNIYGCACEDDDESPLPSTRFTDPPLFPAVVSLTLINQCFMPDLVGEILGETPLPDLKTLTLCPEGGSVVDVRSALQYAVRRSSQNIPGLRLSRELFSAEDWQAGGTNVELFDPEEVIKASISEMNECIAVLSMSTMIICIPPCYGRHPRYFPACATPLSTHPRQYYWPKVVKGQPM